MIFSFTILLWPLLSRYSFNLSCCKYGWHSTTQKTWENNRSLSPISSSTSSSFQSLLTSSLPPSPPSFKKETQQGSLVKPFLLTSLSLTLLPWFTAGGILAVFSKLSVLVMVKLDIPMAFTNSFSTNSSIPCTRTESTIRQCFGHYLPNLYSAYELDTHGWDLVIVTRTIKLLKFGKIRGKCWKPVMNNYHWQYWRDSRNETSKPMCSRWCFVHLKSSVS